MIPQLSRDLSDAPSVFDRIGKTLCQCRQQFLRNRAWEPFLVLQSQNPVSHLLNSNYEIDSLDGVYTASIRRQFNTFALNDSPKRADLLKSHSVLIGAA